MLRIYQSLLEKVLIVKFPWFFKHTRNLYPNNLDYWSESMVFLLWRVWWSVQQEKMKIFFKTDSVCQHDNREEFEIDNRCPWMAWRGVLVSISDGLRGENGRHLIKMVSSMIYAQIINVIQLQRVQIEQNITNHNKKHGKKILLILMWSINSVTVSYQPSKLVTRVRLPVNA